MEKAAGFYGADVWYTHVATLGGTLSNTWRDMAWRNAVCLVAFPLQFFLLRAVVFSSAGKSDL